MTATAAPGIVTGGNPPNAVVQIQPGMQVQPVVLVDQNGNYITSSGGTAIALATTGGPVNVSNGTSPTAGQILTANSGTAATFQALTAGQIPGTLNGTTFSGTITPSAGIAPYKSGFTSFATGGAANLLNATSGGNQVPIAGTFYYAATFIPMNVTLTGVIVSSGTVGTTDNWIVALWPGTGGAALATSSLSGIVAPAANTKKAFPFTGTVNVDGPGAYIIGIQSNGTTARFLSFSNAVEGFITGQLAGTFATIPSLTPASTYSANAGPFATTY